MISTSVFNNIREPSSQEPVWLIAFTDLFYNLVKNKRGCSSDDKLGKSKYRQCLC